MLCQSTSSNTPCRHIHLHVQGSQEGSYIDGADRAATHMAPANPCLHSFRRQVQHFLAAVRAVTEGVSTTGVVLRWYIHDAGCAPQWKASWQGGAGLGSYCGTWRRWWSGHQLRVPWQRRWMWRRRVDIPLVRQSVGGRGVATMGIARAHASFNFAWQTGALVGGSPPPQLTGEIPHAV